MYKTVLLSGLVFVGTVFVLGGCSAAEEETPVEKAEEEAGVEEVIAEETTEPTAPEPTTSVESSFEGEHENLEPGDTAVWTSGMQLTISEVYIAPNEGKALQQKAEERQKERGKDSTAKSKAQQEPDELVVYRWVIENNGSEPIRFNNDFPCEFLDENGVALRPGGTTREEMEELKGKGPRPLEQPVEPGQRREDTDSVAPPLEGDTILIVCVQPPRAGEGPGKTKVAQASEGSKASWLINVAELERRS